MLSPSRNVWVACRLEATLGQLVTNTTDSRQVKAFQESRSESLTMEWTDNEIAPRPQVWAAALSGSNPLPHLNVLGDDLATESRQIENAAPPSPTTPGSKTAQPRVLTLKSRGTPLLRNARPSCNHTRIQAAHTHTHTHTNTHTHTHTCHFCSRLHYKHPNH